MQNVIVNNVAAFPSISKPNIFTKFARGRSFKEVELSRLA
jgi:hypothetical protein